MFDMRTTTATPNDSRQLDRRAFRWLMGFAISCFFLVSVVTRLLPRALRPLAAPGSRRESCLEEARRTAHAVIPYAFEW